MMNALFMSPTKEDQKRDPRGLTGNLDEDSAKALQKKILVHFHRNRSKGIEAAIEKMVAEGA